MKNLPLASFFGLTLLASVGCGDSGTPNPDEGQHPQQTEWKKVVTDLPFPLSGDGKISSLSIGRLEYNDNFANRGDVEVYLDNEAEVISIEMQVYDFTDDLTAQGDDTVDGTLERLQLWAYVNSGNPKTPGEMDDTKNCTKDTWKSGCQVLAYYDGKAEPVRLGVNLRIHLPKAYKGSLDITTQDNSNEPSFPLVSDVTVMGLCGSSNINMAQGTAKVKMCSGLTPAPLCSKEQIDNCENFKDDMGNDAAWSNLCDCSAENFGQVKIEAVKPWAGNITVDIPTTTWLNANLANEETDRPHECKPELSACSPDVCTLKDDGTGYAVSGEFNYPSPAAASGAGFNLTVKSAGCNPVKYFASEDDWSAVDEESKPKIEEHGHIKVCTGCL